jgi:uncharacterized protein YbjT (DUF2867 family)
MDTRPVLVTGATGYVGGRLVPQLLSSGYRVRVIGRSLSKLKCKPWASEPKVEFAQADVLDEVSLIRAADGCWAAFYLVHSMNTRHKDFAKVDRKAAQNMVKAAAAGGLRRIIYLGGLGGEIQSLSTHLRSRMEVAAILQAGPVPTTFLRAAMILGSGSASFEMLRYLVERLPVMTTPKWVQTPVQPIAVRNVINYLQGCLEHDEVVGRTFDIGGPDILTYHRLIDTYAEEAHLPRRWIIALPVLTPRLSSYWIHLVTPVPASIARPLAEGLSTPVVCQETRIRSIIPQDLLSCREAIRMALSHVRRQRVETCWSDAGELRPPEWLYCGDAPYAGGTVFESGYRAIVQAPAEEVWKPIKKIGGETGYYFGGVLWFLRGLLDRLVGGAGLRRGRRHPEELYPGDALDFWRVLEVEESRRLVLLAEMKVPGEATLEFNLHPLGPDRTELQQLSRYLPKGLFGILYWYALYPIHQWMFKGMVKNIGLAAGGPLLAGPERFAPRMHHVCAFNPRKPAREKKPKANALTEPTEKSSLDGEG